MNETLKLWIPCLKGKMNLMKSVIFKNFLTERKRTVRYGFEILSYRSPQLCCFLLGNIEEFESLETFRREVKSWICNDCPQRLCKPCRASDFFNHFCCYLQYTLTWKDI